MRFQKSHFIYIPFSLGFTEKITRGGKLLTMKELKNATDEDVIRVILNERINKIVQQYAPFPERLKTIIGRLDRGAKLVGGKWYKLRTKRDIVKRCNK